MLLSAIARLCGCCAKAKNKKTKAKLQAKMSKVMESLLCVAQKDAELFPDDDESVEYYDDMIGFFEKLDVYCFTCRKQKQALIKPQINEYLESAANSLDIGDSKQLKKWKNQPTNKKAGAEEGTAIGRPKVLDYFIEKKKIEKLRTNRKK